MSMPECGAATGQLGPRLDYYYRTADSRDWRPLASFDTRSGEGMIRLAVDPAAQCGLCPEKLNGRLALYRVKLDGSLASELAYSSDQVDVDGAVRANRARGDRRHLRRRAAPDRLFRPAYAAWRACSARDPQSAADRFRQPPAPTATRILVHAGSDSDAGRYYVYDRTARNLNEILMVRPQLEMCRWRACARSPIPPPTASCPPI